MEKPRDSGSLKEGLVVFEPFEVELDAGKTHIDNLDESMHEGPVDLDEILQNYAVDGVKEDGTLFSDDEFNTFRAEDEDEMVWDDPPRFFDNPNKRLLDTDASLIPGSPFSKPAIRPSNRPREPLRIARYASSLAFLGTIATVVFLFFVAIYSNTGNIGQIIVEMILSLLAFFGLFWNIYFTVSSILKCFIPSQAFKTNTKYCSIIPETKDKREEWLDVTIQIPVYKESLVQVLMPTLRSCIAARDSYMKSTDAVCNIVVCDDGMMAMLRDNFPAAEMLWKKIIETQGRVFKLSKLLQYVPRASRFHLKGLRSKDVYEVFHRMLYYYHYDIGFVARSTVDRRGKFKKASNLNSHLRLALGAQQQLEKGNGDVTFEQALLEEVHNHDGSRFVMFGNDIRLGHLICVNDADARMAETVIVKTVPEFLNDVSLGFTQHATKALNEQRDESYFTSMLAAYTDALYQGHFLLSSILGCHPPLVGHSIFLRTEAIKQCGRVRTLRKAQQWLESIGLHFLPVDQVGFANLQADNRIEYWSESHVSEDFELMIHLYSLGFNGRYVNYEGCEFQEGITRTFDEEAGRHRKFALGAHELVFNPFQDMLGKGVFTPVFRTFLKCDIPSYYKIFLTAYLCSYASGGSYIIVFTVSALMRIFDRENQVYGIAVFNPAGIIILNFVVYYVLGYFTFLIAMVRMSSINDKLLFPEYRKKWCGACYFVFTQLRYCFTFQFLFYNVVTFSFYFLGSMDHLLSRPSIVGATNKDSINISRCRAFYDMVSFNLGSWFVALTLLGLAYATVLHSNNWDVTEYPDSKNEYLQDALFAGPAIFLALLAFFVPIIFNPWILGWPFLRKKKLATTKKKKYLPTTKKQQQKRLAPAAKSVDIPTMMMMMNSKSDLDTAIMHTRDELDIETGSLTTNDLQTHGTPSPDRTSRIKRIDPDFIETREAEYKEHMTNQRLPNLQDFDTLNGARLRLRKESLLTLGDRRCDPLLNRSLGSLEGTERQSVPLNGPAKSISWEEPRANSSPSRRLRQPGSPGRQSKSPVVSRSPPHSPSMRNGVSRNGGSWSPGRQRLQPKHQPPPYLPSNFNQNRQSKHDEWGFPVSHNSMY